MSTDAEPQSDLLALLKRANAPVLYFHEQDAGPAEVAIVDPVWLAEVWEAATTDGGFVVDEWTEAGREERFMPHAHTEPEDRRG